MQNIKRFYIRVIVLTLIFKLIGNDGQIYSQFYDLNYYNEFNTYRYFVGISQPDSNWYKPEFNDSTWLTGCKSIGYGDSDDSVLIDTTVSLYIRKTINLNQLTLNEAKELVIYADFDDGFIAYLNGIEIVRVNMDEHILHPSYLQTTTRSHEAENYRFLNSPYYLYKTVQGYYIDSLLLKKCHIGGSNILAFEVHNDSLKGSDMSFCFDYNFINDYSEYNIVSDRGRYYNTVAMDSTPLPIVVVETNEYGCDTSKVKAFMGIIYNGIGKFNKPTDKFNGYKGFINLNIRGNSTRWYPKRSYKVETIDSIGNSNNVALLGMPKENDWALLASFSDKSFLGNTLTFALGNKMGNYEPRSKYCELLVNGRNQGLYMLTELIKRNENRVNIAKLNGTDNDGLDVTGGYIFKNMFIKPWLELVYPTSDNITAAQDQYIKDYYANTLSILKSNIFLDTENGYKKYFDVNSMADFMIIEELTKNNDAYSASFFLHKDRDDIDGRIKFGPSWDYDNAFGFGIWCDTVLQGWQFVRNQQTYIPRMLQDTTFAKLFAEKWHKYRKDILSIDSINKMIDEVEVSIRNSINVNFKIWPILGYSIKPMESTPTPGLTYDDEIKRLKNWIVQRFSWIDLNIDKIYYKVTQIESPENTFSFHLDQIYPNPFNNKVNVIFSIEKPGELKIIVSDLSGRKVALKSQKFNNPGKYEMMVLIDSNISPGFYIMNISEGNRIVASQKLIKVK